MPRGQNSCGLPHICTDRLTASLKEEKKPSLRLAGYLGTIWDLFGETDCRARANVSRKLPRDGGESTAARHLDQRTPWGGWQKEGEAKSYKGHPSQKGFDPPPRMVRCPPPQVSLLYFSSTENQPKEEIFGTDIPRTSGGHSRGCPGPKTSARAAKILKKSKHFGKDIHDPKARTSTTLRGFQKTSVRKLLG